MSKKQPFNDGKKFEELLKLLYEIMLKHDAYTSVEGPRVLVDTPDGKREFDLILRSKVANVELVTAIECRDYNRKLGITHLDAFSSKLEDAI